MSYTTRTLMMVAALALSSVPAQAGAPSAQRVCGLYSSILLAPGEHAEVSGAGANSVSMNVTGPGGSWIFYDGLSPDEASSAGSSEVLRTADRVAYRRAFDARVYAVRPLQNVSVDGKFVEAMASGLDMMRQPLDRPAITGSGADLSVLERVRPGEMSRCNLRWYPGKGLVQQTD